MRNPINLFIMLIMVQTIISCADFERDSIYDEKSTNYRGKPSSSSVRSSSSARSSSSVGSGGSISSSSSKPSSSSAPQNILACSAVPGVGTAGSAISPPLVTCNGSNVSAASISWQGAPNWNNPAAGTYSNIKAQASCGGSPKTADCNGTLTVNPAGAAGVLACGVMPSAATAGSAVSPPLVTCDGSNVGAASISWQGAPAWSNPTAGTYNNVKAQASCGGSPKTADCNGTLTVSPVYSLSCGSVPSTGTAGTAISAPSVTCSGTPSVSAASISWQGAPAWSNPTAGTYSNVKATATCGGQQLSANCSGTLTVSPVYSLSCGSVSSTGIAGTAISAPSVTCSGTPSVSAASISWQGAPAWSNPTAGTYSNVKATATCGGQQLSANCSGTLTVSPVYSLACGSVPSAGTAGAAISAPSVTCSGTPSVSAASVSWQGAPAWSNPTAGTYSNVKASASCGGQQLSANCSGTLTVSIACTNTQGSGTFTDSRDSETYSYVTICNQTWMAKNLNFTPTGTGVATTSSCYSNSESNCTKYGKLYNWATAMALTTDCNSSTCASQVSAKHRGICPSGWHIPTQAEWNALRSYIESDKGCSNCDGKHLKATDGWSSCSASGSSYSCVDSYGFAALPGGFGFSYGVFGSAGDYGDWWSSSESSADNAYSRSMRYYNEHAFWSYDYKTSLLSVRCVRD